MNLQHPISLVVLVASRRRFVNGLLASAGFVALAPLNALAQEEKRGAATQPRAAAAPDNTVRDLKTVMRSTFRPYLSDYFQTTDGFGTPLSLLLLSLNDLPSPPSFTTRQKEKDWRENCFSITFRGPLALPLRQNTYKLKHPVLGELQIFLVPVGQVAPSSAWRDYEAVFNRMAG